MNSTQPRCDTVAETYYAIRMGAPIGRNPTLLVSDDDETPLLFATRGEALLALEPMERGPDMGVVEVHITFKKASEAMILPPEQEQILAHPTGISDLVIHPPVDPNFFASGMAKMRHAIIHMKPGEFFFWQNPSKPLQAAKEVGLKVHVEKTGQGNWKVTKL